MNAHSLVIQILALSLKTFKMVVIVMLKNRKEKWTK